MVNYFETFQYFDKILKNNKVNVTNFGVVL